MTEKTPSMTFFYYVVYFVNRSGLVFCRCSLLFVSKSNSQSQNFHLGRIQHCHTAVHRFSVVSQRVHVSKALHEYVTGYNDNTKHKFVIYISLV